MKRSVLCLWLGFGLTTTSLVLGCRSNRPCTNCGYAPVPAAVMLNGLTEPEPTVVVPAKEAPKPAVPVAEVAPFSASDIVLAGANHELDKASEKKDEAVGPSHFDRPHLSDRRSFTDITAHPAFAHDPNYHWLVGILDRRADSGWILRYASLEEDDRYNGHVVLAPAQSMSRFHVGDIVRVEGEITDPGFADVLAMFRTRSIVVVPDRQPSGGVNP